MYNTNQQNIIYMKVFIKVRDIKNAPRSQQKH